MKYELPPKEVLELEIGLVRGLTTNVDRLGDYYIMLDGKIPHGLALAEDEELLGEGNPPLNWYGGIAFPIEGIRMVMIGREFCNLENGEMEQQLLLQKVV